MKRIATLLLIPGIAVLLNACAEPAPVTPEVTRPGLTRELVSVTTTTDGNMLIPVDTYTELAGTPGVFVLSPRKQARFRMVKVGKRRKDELEVISGLVGNETLIRGPYEDMLDGSPIATSSQTGTEQ